MCGMDVFERLSQHSLHEATIHNPACYASLNSTCLLAGR